jgi:hypothetical protein
MVHFLIILALSMTFREPPISDFTQHESSSEVVGKQETTGFGRKIASC